MSTTTTTNDSPAQIEREVERTRAEVSGTLDALRQKLSPQQMVDQFAEQAMDYLRGSGGTQFASNLGSQVRDNPLPVLLIGAGVAWLMMGGNGRGASSSPYGARSTTDVEHDRGPRYVGPDNAPRALVRSAGEVASRARVRVTDTASDLGGMASDAASSARAMASDAASSVSDAASRAGDAISDTASRLGDAITGAAGRVREAAGYHAASVPRRAQSSWQGMDRLAADQPLLFGALGLALGAALGAILPRTEAEDEWMGEARDRLAGEAGQMASQAYEQVREVAGEHVSRVAEAASGAYAEARERLQTDGIAGAGEAIGKAAEDVTRAAGEAVRGLSDEARRAAEAGGTATRP